MASQCPFAPIKAPGPFDKGCYTFDLSTMTSATFTINDTYPEPYLVAAPCRDASVVSCPSCNGKSHGVASAYQVLCAAERCLSLNNNGGGKATATVNANATTGLSVRLTGGDGDRSITYDLKCDPKATGALDRPTNPMHNAPTPMQYTVTWPTAAACPTYDAGETCTAPTPAPTLPVLPTAPQLLYQQHEIMALIHFNMATFAHNGDPGCNSDNWAKKASYAAGLTNDPKTFNPEKLNTTQWIDVMQDLGAKHATLTAKHGCGFLLWPTKSTLPDGETPYGYDASAFGRNVLMEFSQAAEKAGIGHGFYYSLTNNFYLNVHTHVAQPGPALPGQQLVTQAEFEAIALAQVTELWTEFGNLTEIWCAALSFLFTRSLPLNSRAQPSSSLSHTHTHTHTRTHSLTITRTRTGTYCVRFDGGYTSDMKAKITALLLKNQPNTNAFGGLGVTPNAVCWVGTESGNPGGEIWSTGGSNSGDPDSSIWCPKGCDTTLQNGDVWFYEEGNSIRTLAQLINVYHATVGMNGMLELDFAIDRNGLVHPEHAARYKELGDWTRACYPDTPAHVTSGSCTAGKPCILEINISTSGGATIDRAMVRENLAEGQLVRSYSIELVTATGSAAIPFSVGHSVGNKRIDVGKVATGIVKARLTIHSHVGATVDITRFAVYSPCPSA